MTPLYHTFNFLEGSKVLFSFDVVLQISGEPWTPNNLLLVCSILVNGKNPTNMDDSEVQCPKTQLHIPKFNVDRVIGAHATISRMKGCFTRRNPVDMC